MSYAEQRARDYVLTARELLKTLPQSCADFVRSIEPVTQPLTRLAYVYDLKLFFNYLIKEAPEFGDYALYAFDDAAINNITARHLLIYGEYLSLYIKDDERTETNDELGKMRKLASLRSYFKFMFRAGRTDRDVSQLIELPKTHEKPILRLEADEVARILDAAAGDANFSERQKQYLVNTRLRDVAILTLFLGTGVRVSELVGLDIDHLNFENNSFLVTRKGGAQVILYFSDEVADAIKAYLSQRNALEDVAPADSQALFLSLQKRRISVRAVENMVKKYAMQAAPLKKRISPHKLRSTYGTNLYNETGDIYLVADVLGHADVNTTKKHYAAMSDERRRMAAKAIKLRDDKKAD